MAAYLKSIDYGTGLWAVCTDNGPGTGAYLAKSPNLFLDSDDAVARAKELAQEETKGCRFKIVEGMHIP